MQEHQKAPQSVGIYNTSSVEDEPYRENLPEEDWLAALCRKVLDVIYAALDAHEVAEGADCDCSLHNDLVGISFNLDSCVGLITGQLVHTDNIEALEIVIDRRTRLEPTVNGAELDQLLRLFDLLLSATQAVRDVHDAAHADGRCDCLLCGDLFALAWNVEMARDLIGGELRSINTVEEVEAELIDLRARQRAKDGPGCRCDCCRMSDETVHALAEVRGVRAFPIEPEADVPINVRPTERAAAAAVAFSAVPAAAEAADEYVETINLLRRRAAGHATDCRCGRCKALARLLAYEDDQVSEPTVEPAVVVATGTLSPPAVKPTVPSAPRQRHYWEPSDS